MADPEHPGAIASPLSVLLADATAGGDAEEVLLLSFTLDLGFFERTALSVARALGARVTVVGDGGAVTHDPRSVRRAGRSYVAGLASCPKAFHPKVVVVAGTERATIAVGSGNVTLAGWQENHELWTILRAGPGGAPSTVGQIGRWLVDLPSAATFSHRVVPALERVAALLSGFEATEAGPKAVSPLWGPVIDQLPGGGPVDELNVCCPFHDPGAVALGRLVERYQPSLVNVAVQAGLTVCDGPAIDELVRTRGGQVIEVAANRYRHGKLIEVAADGRRWALTGSANCSGAALLKATRAGGNIELGLVTDITNSLMPVGTPYSSDQLRAHIYAPRPMPRPAIELLGASRVDDGLEVQLARRLTTAAHLELSPPEAQPDTWWRLGELKAGDQVVTVARSVEGGSRLRVVGDTAHGPVYSNVVPVLDPVRALRRAGGGGDLRHEIKLYDLFENTGLAETFVADLGALGAGRLAAPKARVSAAGVGAGTGTGAGNIGAHVDHGNWEDYLDRCAGRLGNSLLRFALGLPQLAAEPASWTDLVAAAWDEDLPAENDFGLEGDKAEDVAASADDPLVARIPSLDHQPASVRARYRKWATTLAARTGDLGPLERTLGLRLVIWTAAAGAWDRSDTGWLTAIGKATEGLGAAPAPPAELEPSAASLAAVAISILRAQAPRTARTPATYVFERAAKAIAHLLPAVDARYIEVYTELLDVAFGLAVDPSVVEGVAGEIVQADPLADAIRALEDIGIYDAHRHARVLHTPGPCANPRLRALTAVGYAESGDPVGAWAGDSATWALVVWRRPDLVVLTHDQADLWSHYQLTGSYTPRACAAGRNIDSRFRVGGPIRGFDLSDAARQVLDAVGLDDLAPPPCE